MIARHRSWLELQEIRQRHHRAWTAFFEDWDVLLAPVIVTAAFDHLQEGGIGERLVPMDGTPRPYLDLIMWTTMIGSAELPSTVVPVGRTPEGLPVGIQIIGPHLEDRTTLAAGPPPRSPHRRLPTPAPRHELTARLRPIQSA